MLVKTKGIVLTETPYSETSKILNILTEDYGLIGVISKGCRNIKNKLRGISNKLIYAEFTLSYKENGLSTLTDGSVINSYKNFYTDFKKASYAYYYIDIVNKVLKENNNKEIYYLLESSLLKLNDGLSEKLLSNILELKLLKYLGVEINLNSCTVCNDNNIYNLDITNGGTVCKNCNQSDYIFDKRTIKLMTILSKIDISKITKLDIEDESIFNEMDKFIREYYNTYTGIYLKEKDNLNKMIFS